MTPQKKPLNGVNFVDVHVHVQSVDGIKDIAAAGIAAERDAGSLEAAGLNVKKTIDGSSVVRSSGRSL